MNYLEKIWSSKIVTNNGPFHQKFEKLAKYLNVEYVSILNNTNSLLVAIKALELSEIITTPFSFAATAHSIIWNGLKPVFVDTDSHAGNLSSKS